MQYFCNANHIDVDFDSCATPFWTTDQRDFLYGQTEWDVKNNFLYHTGDILTEVRYTDLPALVPNRFNGDQWSQRGKVKLKGSREVKFLFTFMKNADLTGGKRGEPFITIRLTEAQHILLRQLYAKYNGLPQLKEPFDEARFWKGMDERGGLNLFQLHHRPTLVITAYADASHWNLFADTGRNAATITLPFARLVSTKTIRAA